MSKIVFSHSQVTCGPGAKRITCLRCSGTGGGKLHSSADSRVNCTPFELSAQCCCCFAHVTNNSRLVPGTDLTVRCTGGSRRHRQCGRKHRTAPGSLEAWWVIGVDARQAIVEARRPILVLLKTAGPCLAACGILCTGCAAVRLARRDRLHASCKHKHETKDGGGWRGPVCHGVLL